MLSTSLTARLDESGKSGEEVVRQTLTAEHPGTSALDNLMLNWADPKQSQKVGDHEKNAGVQAIDSWLGKSRQGRGHRRL